MIPFNRCLLSRALLTICVATIMSGCASSPPPPPTILEVPPQRQKELGYPAENRQEGSLWTDQGELADLFMDRKARRVGDIVTIEIVESSSASNKATTETDRESSLSAGVEKFFGIEDRYLDSNHPDFKQFRDFNPFAAAGEASVKGSMSSDFEGNGITSRSGDVKATLTARVVEVLPSGNLRIIGSREVTVNHEQQIITLYGMIRPRDISADNVILSSSIADARIAYSGSGIINDRQRPGWISNILNNVWPF